MAKNFNPADVNAVPARMALSFYKTDAEKIEFLIRRAARRERRASRTF